MNRLRLWTRAFFGFSRTETNAFIILLPLMLVLLLSEPLYRRLYLSQIEYTHDDLQSESLISRLRWKVDSVPQKARNRETVHFHAFDPNAVTGRELINLSMPEYLASRLVKYREKGGVFRKKEDLLKIYGMDTAWFQKVKQWITITRHEPSPWKKTSKQTQTIPMLDINTADSLQLIEIYGIGPVLAKRIRTFREKLGGFVSMEQLREVYGLDTTVVLVLKKRFNVATDFHPRRININTAPFDELTSHPYIKRREAQTIISYRLQHRTIDSVGQLLEIKLLDVRWVGRVRPYLTVQVVGNQ